MNAGSANPVPEVAVSFIPQNPLEESLVNAVNDPAARPQFYRDLIAADIFVMREGAPPEQTGPITLNESDEVALRMIEWNGAPFIPIFTSLQRMQEVLKEESAYLSLNALQFMQLTAGADLVLNPGSEFGKEFRKDEIAAILDGSIWQPGERREIESDTQVLVGHPANYPQDLVDALSRLFEKKPDVIRAYVAHVVYPTGDAAAEQQKGHTLIAVEAIGEWEELASSIGMLVREVQCPDPPVDLMRLAGNGGIEDYFTKDTRPFFERKAPH